MKWSSEMSVIVQPWVSVDMLPLTGTTSLFYTTSMVKNPSLSGSHWQPWLHNAWIVTVLFWWVWFQLFILYLSLQSNMCHISATKVRFIGWAPRIHHHTNPWSSANHRNKMFCFIFTSPCDTNLKRKKFFVMKTKWIVLSQFINPIDLSRSDTLGKKMVQPVIKASRLMARWTYI